MHLGVKSISSSRQHANEDVLQKTLRQVENARDPRDRTGDNTTREKYNARCHPHSSFVKRHVKARLRKSPSPGPSPPASCRPAFRFSPLLVRFPFPYFPHLRASTTPPPLSLSLIMHPFFSGSLHSLSRCTDTTGDGYKRYRRSKGVTMDLSHVRST